MGKFEPTPRVKAKSLTPESLQKIAEEKPAPPAKKVNGREFDWQESPLSEALVRLNDLKRQYEQASRIVLQRQSRAPMAWKCWSQSHKSRVPKSVLAQCRADVADGKWVFKDDGAHDEHGHVQSIVCCSQLCFTVYQQNRPVGGLSRH